MMVSDQHARVQLGRLSVVHTALNAAKTFDTFVDVVTRDRRLMNEDLTEAIDALLGSVEDIRVTPGRVIDFAMRARSVRLRVARALREADAPGPSVVPCGDICPRCGGMLEYLVAERAVWCPTCRTVQTERTGIDSVKVREVDARTLDGEIRLYEERRALERQEAAA